MMISFRALNLLFSFSLFIIGCKTSESSSTKTLNEVQEKVKVIESFKTILVSEDDDILEDNIIESESIREYTGVHRLGDRMINLKFWIKGAGLTFVNLHDDENTSVKAALVVIDSIGGRLIELRHSGERNIRFEMSSSTYEFDPNRMFTDKGTKKSMKKFGPFSKKAHSNIRALAQHLIDSLDLRMIVTLHNSSDENYSSLSYLDEYKNDAAEVFINPERDPDDFFFVTTEVLFDKFKNLGYNTVLQNNATMTDDGSLSVLAGRQGIPYINVEAQHGHFDEQVEMLFTLVSVLGEL